MSGVASQKLIVAPDTANLVTYVRISPGNKSTNLGSCSAVGRTFSEAANPFEMRSKVARMSYGKDGRKRRAVQLFRAWVARPPK
jgi:hypothetical protein